MDDDALSDAHSDAHSDSVDEIDNPTENNQDNPTAPAAPTATQTIQSTPTHQPSSIFVKHPELPVQSPHLNCAIPTSLDTSDEQSVDLNSDHESATHHPNHIPHPFSESDQPIGQSDQPIGQSQQAGSNKQRTVMDDTTMDQLQHGKINILSKQSSTIKYVVVPKDYFLKKDVDKSVSKIFAALGLEKPDMIFKVPQSYTIREYFTHDSPYSIPDSFATIYNAILRDKIAMKDPTERKKIKADIKHLIEISQSLEKVKWTYKTNQIIKSIFPHHMHMNDTNDMTSQQAINQDESTQPTSSGLLSGFQNIGIFKSGQQKDQSWGHHMHRKTSGQISRPTARTTTLGPGQFSHPAQLPHLDYSFTTGDMTAPAPTASHLPSLVQSNNIPVDVPMPTITDPRHANPPRYNRRPPMTDQELIYRINRLEHHRKLVEERLKTIIQGLTDACQQANAYIWMQPQTQDELGSFVSKYSISNTTIFSDAFIDRSKIIHDKTTTYHKSLHEHFETFATSTRTTVIPNQWDHCTESFYKTLIASSTPFDSDESVDKFTIIEYNMDNVIESLEKTCRSIATSMPDNWKLMVSKKGTRWERCLAGKRHWLLHPTDDGEELHILHYFQFLKPGLTHMVYWHDKNDASVWKKYLQEQFPLGMFLIGCKTEGYRDATTCMRKNQPLFVFDQTGGSASIVSHMIKFMKEDRYRRPSTIETMQYPTDEKRFKSPKKYHYLNSERFIDIQNQSRVMLQNWPDPFNPNSVLVINTLTDSIENLQNNITKTMNAVFEDIPELGGRKEDEVRLAYAWTKYAMLKRNAAKLQLRANIYIGLLAFLTVMTTVVSTLVVRIDHWAMHLASVGLPIITGIVITFMYTFKPINKWAVCEIGARMIQGEIYKFRTKTGIYRVVRKHGSMDKSGVKKARRLFAEELIKVWQSLELSEMKVGSLNTRKEFNEVPIHDLPIIQTIQHEEVAALKQYNYQNYYDATHLDLRDGNGHGNTDNPVCTVEDFVHIKSIKKYNKMLASRHHDWKDSEHSLGSSRTTRRSSSNHFGGHSSRTFASSTTPIPTVSAPAPNYKPRQPETIDNTVDQINPCDKMSVEIYVKTRLNLILYRHKRQSPWLERIVYFMQTFIFIITASAAFVSHIGYAQWVPVIMSVATMLTSIMEQKQLILRLTSTNSVHMQLEQLMCFWQGLSIIERRKHSNATYVVETTEAAVMNELASYIQAVKSVVNDDQE